MVAVTIWGRAISWRGHRAHFVVCAALIVFTAAYLIPLISRGWIPHDEGTLAQSAHRILLGQSPHRDFDEMYTGGLSFLHAAAFRTLGENLVALRIVLFVTVLLVTPVVYYIASRFVPPIAACAVCVCSFAWSFPNYPASMPSWYNLVFALCGSAALLRYLETDRLRWVFIAGFCGGLSVVVKIIGVYFIAAAALFIVVDVSTESQSRRGIGLIVYTATLAILGVLVIALVPFAIIGRTLDLALFVELALPVSACGMVAAALIFRNARAGFSWRISDIARVALPFALGVVIPLMVFAAVYADWQALPSLYRGLFLLPRKRLELATVAGPPLVGFLLATPLLRVLLSKRYSDPALRTYEIFSIVILQCAVIAWSAIDFRVFNLVWLSVRLLAPLLVVSGLIMLLLSRSADAPTSLEHRRLFLMLAVTAWCALVQFPYGAFVYFGYVAPLVILSTAALFTARGTLSPRLAAPLLLSYIALGFMVRPQLFGRELPQVVVGRDSSSTLDLARGGLVVGRDERNDYVQLARLVQQHSRSRYIYVTPDAPEVYFLTERENPTRTIFDVFDEPDGRENRILAEIRDHGVDVVVINRKPAFSGKIPPTLYDSLAYKFPHAAAVGRFEVRWRS